MSRTNGWCWWVSKSSGAARGACGTRIGACFRQQADDRTKRPAVGIPASQPACNFLESRPPALVHMGRSLNTCCLSSPCSHFVIRERSNIEPVKKADQTRMVCHCEKYELMSFVFVTVYPGAIPGPLTGDIFMKPPKATSNKRESQVGGFTSWWKMRHGSKQRDVLRGNFHLGLIASVGGVHHHHQ